MNWLKEKLWDEPIAHKGHGWVLSAYFHVLCGFVFWGQVFSSSLALYGLFWVGSHLLWRYFSTKKGPVRKPRYMR